MIAGRVFFHPEAVEEAEAAALWYRGRSPRAAARFIDEISQVIEKIAAAPRRWPAGPRETRRAKLPCFPFAVIYREKGDAIQILAVAHGKRRPGYWRSRR